MVDAAFAHRRKALRGALRDLAGSSEAAEAALTAAGRRPAGARRVADRRGVRPDRGGVWPMSDSSLTVRAAAKINLLLGVGAPRPDGFHTLVTVYQAVSLYDDLTVTARRRTLTVDDRRRGVHRREPPAPSRPQHRRPGRRGARRSTTAGRCGAEVRIDKTIPIAGGLAGGSADGAAALLALDRLHDLGTTDDDLLTLAAGLGSDVPFALVGGSALGEGHGEVVTPRRRPTGSWWWVVVPSEEGMSTPAVYRHYDELRPDAPLGARPAGRDRRRRWRAATYAAWPRPCTTTSSRPPATCGPTSPS